MQKNHLRTLFCLLLVQSYFLIADPPNTPQQTPISKNYPTIPAYTEYKQTIIPISSSLPTKGEHSIIGQQMLAGMANYLREYKHFATQQAESTRKFIIKHAYNVIQYDEPFTKSIATILKASPVIIGLQGCEMLNALTEKLREKKCVLLFPLEGSPSFRAAQHENVIYFRPSYEQELKALAHYAISLAHKTSIAIVYENSLWGNDACSHLKNILASYNIKPTAIESYAQGTIEIEHALSNISKTSPNTIFCLAQPRPAYTFISQALNVGLHECLFLGLSQLAPIQKLLSTTRGLDLTVSSVVPNAQTSEIELIKEYNKTMKTFLSFRDDSPFYLEAFIMMSLLEECFKRMKTPFTIAKLIATLQSFKNTDFKGLSLNFDPATSTLSTAVWINPGINKEWITYNDER